jgi:hypothetical protein
MTGGKGGSYLVVGPGWKGVGLVDMAILRSPTDIVWIVGRI